jgi:dUTP pyrophosphatase
MSEEKITQEELKQIEDILENIGDSDDVLENFEALLALPDEQFEIIAPGILDSFAMSVNNPNDRLILVQSLMDQGYKREDLADAFDEGYKAIMEMDELSEVKKNFFIQILGSISNAIAETEGISKRIIQIPVELCHENAKIPQYAHTSDSGMDVYALDDYVIAPGETKLIPTGIKVAIPPGYELQVRPKSGRCLRTKLRVANTPGTIDAGYRDEIGVIVENIEPPIKDIGYEPINDEGGRTQELKITSIEFGQSYSINKGDKFCQLVLSEVPKVAFFRVDKVGEIGDDRGGGFGSTGVN